MKSARAEYITNMPHGSLRLGDTPLPHRAYVGGTWFEAGSGATIAVTNPANGSIIGYIPDLSAAEIDRAIEEAEKALPAWRSLLAKERAHILRQWAALMRRYKEDLAAIITLEQGKPLTESYGEIDYAAGFLDWFAEEAVRAYGATIPTHLKGSRLMTWREPVGVVGVITPWNFPSAMLTRKIGAALAIGCTVVAHPSPETPYSAIALAALAEKAGVPRGVLSLVTGNSRTFLATLMASAAVRQVSFTGSTEVGRIVMRGAADTIKRVSMELGGHAPFIVFDDADINHAVRECLNAKFCTTGQDCLAANRILVHQSLHDAFCEKFADAVAKLKIGDGFSKGVEIGPLINAKAIAKCEDHVADAVHKGAVILTGGKRLGEEGNFFQPTVLRNITREMKIFKEETFGPVAAIMPFANDCEAIAIANNTIYGLAAYIYTNSMSRAWRVSEALDYGMVMLNTAKMTGASVPFGGMKQSGIGREGSSFGMDEFAEIKSVCIGNLCVKD